MDNSDQTLKSRRHEHSEEAPLSLEHMGQPIQQHASTGPQPEEPFDRPSSGQARPEDACTKTGRKKLDSQSIQEHGPS